MTLKLSDNMYIIGETKIHNWIIISLIIFCGVLLFPTIANGFNIYPNVIEITLSAGEERTGSFTVSNPGDTNIKIKVSVEDWSAEQDGKEVKRGEFPSLSWLQLSPQELELEPNESETVTYTVSVSDDAKGEYAAMIYFGTLPGPSKEGVSIVKRIGNALYAIVEGTEVVKGKVSEIKISRTDPLKIDAVVKNEGNIHIRPKGKIIIRKKGLFLTEEEREPKEIPFNKAGFPVLPGQNYVFESRSKERLDSGRYSLELIMDFGEERFHEMLEFKLNRDCVVIYDENKSKK